MNKTITEADIFNEMASPDVEDFDAEAAKALISMRFTPKAIARMNELAEMNRNDAISAADKEEMEKFKRVGNVLSFLKGKARLSLSKRHATP